MEISTPYEVKELVVDEKGLFEGFASDFKDEADDGGDIVKKGAFLETIAHGGRNRSGIVMLWQHKSDQIPGVWRKIEEQQDGLFVAGKLALGTPLGDSTHVLMGMDAIKHFSYGYDAIDYEINKEREVRFLKKVELWEISPVTFPMLIRTAITNVKALTEAKTERELERALRDSGLSKSEATFIASMCKASLRELRNSQHPVSLGNALKMLQELNAELEVQDIFADINKSLKN